MNEITQNDEIAQLIEGARDLGIGLGAKDATRLLRLLDELSRWNRSYNLTAITDRAEMITHHLLDSLSIHRDLHGPRVADVGTGAGFPGLPLALVNPDKELTLIDSNHKKIRFVSHAARTLELKNVIPLHARVERLKPEQPFDTIVARAFAALPEILEQVSGLCGADSRVVAMKGRHVEQELAGLPAPWSVLEARAVSVPGLGEARTVLTLTRQAGAT